MESCDLAGPMLKLGPRVLETATVCCGRGLRDCQRGDCFVSSCADRRDFRLELRNAHGGGVRAGLGITPAWLNVGRGGDDLRDDCRAAVG